MSWNFKIRNFVDYWDGIDKIIRNEIKKELKVLDIPTLERNILETIPIKLSTKKWYELN